jgi:hypothetical protein
MVAAEQHGPWQQFTIIFFVEQPFDNSGIREFGPAGRAHKREDTIVVCYEL